jgi:hypothetical protein
LAGQSGALAAGERYKEIGDVAAKDAHKNG